jgi:membrane protease YdiL (CAAX protease family)
MRIGQATGMQIAFLMFALMLLAVPLAEFLLKATGFTGTTRTLLERGIHLALAGLVVAAFPRLRRFAMKELSRPIPAAKRVEVAVVALAKLAQAFAVVVAIAFLLWVTQGPERVDRMAVGIEREAANAFSGSSLVLLTLAVLVGPIVEELVFRGFVYRAFERQWGWFASMLATSILFGLYHAHFWSAFLSSMIFICVLRRTGSLRAPILVHMFFNLMLWPPLLGQYVFPRGVSLSDVATWHFHVACLIFVAIALPIYVWMSRDRHAAAPTLFLQPNGAIPK